MKALFFLLCACAAFADDIFLNNESAYPVKHQSKMAIQWASSGHEVDAANNASLQGKTLNPHALQMIASQGKVRLAAPKGAESFRVLVWSKEGEEEPDLMTNWVDVVSKKHYTLKTDQLFPAVLMYGTGC